MKEMKRNSRRSAKKNGQKGITTRIINPRLVYSATSLHERMLGRMRMTDHERAETPSVLSASASDMSTLG